MKNLKHYPKLLQNIPKTSHNEILLPKLLYLQEFRNFIPLSYQVEYFLKNNLQTYTIYEKVGLLRGPLILHFKVLITQGVSVI